MKIMKLVPSENYPSFPSLQFKFFSPVPVVHHLAPPSALVGYSIMSALQLYQERKRGGRERGEGEGGRQEGRGKERGRKNGKEGRVKENEIC